MEKWKKFSRDPLKRVKIASTRHSSKVKCVNCGRVLTSEFKIANNDAGYQRCRCGYTNYFTCKGDFLWEVIVGKTEEGQQKATEFSF